MYVKPFQKTDDKLEAVRVLYNPSAVFITVSLVVFLVHHNKCLLRNVLDSVGDERQSHGARPTVQTAPVVHPDDRTLIFSKLICKIMDNLICGRTARAGISVRLTA